MTKSVKALEEINKLLNIKKPDWYFINQKYNLYLHLENLENKERENYLSIAFKNKNTIIDKTNNTSNDITVATYYVKAYIFTQGPDGNKRYEFISNGNLKVDVLENGSSRILMHSEINGNIIFNSLLTLTKYQMHDHNAQCIVLSIFKDERHEIFLIKTIDEFVAMDIMDTFDEYTDNLVF
jgi:hypothetical protein